MNIHKNARLTPLGRERIVRLVLSGQTPEAAARAVGVCPRTIRKWVARFAAEGIDGLRDRSSRPHRLNRPTPHTIVAQIEALRRQRWTGKQIAAETGVSPATVSRILKRLGLNRIEALEPPAVASTGSAIASQEIGGARATAGAWEGSSSTSASMTPRASPSPRSSRMKRRSAQLNS